MNGSSSKDVSNEDPKDLKSTEDTEPVAETEDDDGDVEILDDGGDDDDDGLDLSGTPGGIL